MIVGLERVNEKIILDVIDTFTYAFTYSVDKLGVIWGQFHQHFMSGFAPIDLCLSFLHMELSIECKSWA